jgi:hypothetical protein
MIRLPSKIANKMLSKHVECFANRVSRLITRITMRSSCLTLLISHFAHAPLRVVDIWTDLHVSFGFTYIPRKHLLHFNFFGYRF